MAQINMPTRRDKTAEALSTILTGLTIAEKVHGLVAPDETKDLIKKQHELAIKQQESQLRQDEQASQGVLTKPSQLALMAKGITLSNDDPGGKSVQFSDESGSPIYASIREERAKQTPLMQITKADKNGKPATVLADPFTGQEVTSFPSVEGQEKPQLHMVQATNDKGEKVNMLVDLTKIAPGTQISTGELTASGKASQPIQRRVNDMSAEEKKAFGQVVFGSQTLDQLQQEFDQNPDPSNRIKFIGSNRYSVLTGHLTDVIGRLRSGGAINGEEEKNFRNMMPTALDDPKVAEFKLKELKSLFDSELKIKGNTDVEELKKSGLWNMPEQPIAQASNGKDPQADHDINALEQEIQRRADARQKAQTGNKVPFAPWS